MDQINKNDQLFREKLDQIEFQPSGQAWEKVQGSITSQSGSNWSSYLKVAASIVLLLTIGLLFYPKQDNTRVAINEISTPQPLEVPAIDIPVDATPAKVELKAPARASNAVKTVAQSEKKTVDEPVQTVREPLELAMIADVQIADEPVVSEELVIDETIDEPAVKITYFTARSTDSAAEEMEQDTVKNNLFDKMKFFAKNVSPVEILTDLRTAKEELIENGFKRN